jgi:hypothetical protein
VSHFFPNSLFLKKMGKKKPQQPAPQVHSSKQNTDQQSAPLATADSTLEKAKKPKAAEVEPTLSSLPPPVSTLETVKNSKPNAAESAPSLLSPKC